MPAEPAELGSLARTQNVHRLLFRVLGFWWGIELLRVSMGLHWPASLNFAEGILPVLAAVTVLVGLARRFPLQNIVAVAVLIAIPGTLISSFGQKQGVPFGSYVYGAGLGPKLLGVPWVIPFLWITMVLSSRGAARLILRPWREHPECGVWVIGLTALLVTLMDLCLEPYASQVKQYWLWQTAPRLAQWYGAPWINSVAWLGMTLVVLLLATPFLISKLPVRQAYDRHPFAIWLGLNLLFTLGNATQQLWPAVVLGCFSSLAVGLLAWHGARAPHLN